MNDKDLYRIDILRRQVQIESDPVVAKMIASELRRLLDETDEPLNHEQKKDKQ